MKDGIVKGNGDSRYLKSAIPPGTTWEQALAMLQNGAFPIDLAGINPAGWAVLGSALNKGNVLPDDVCDALGIDREEAEPKDAFMAMPAVLGMGRLSIQTRHADGTPWAHCPLSGLEALSESKRLTDDNGNRIVFVDAGTYTITVQGADEYLDIEINTEVVTVEPGQTVGVTLAGTAVTPYVEITSTRNIRLSQNVSGVDVFAVGGGGKGGAATSSYPGGGGGGGRTATVVNAGFAPDLPYQATVGAGGSSGAGGTSSLLGCIANGGNAGASSSSSAPAGGSGGSGGGGSGASNNNAGPGGSDGSNGGASLGSGGAGQNSTTRAFGDPSGALFSGGGGGGGNNAMSGGAGGSGGGGTGGYNGGNGANGVANTGGGGGGGSKSTGTGSGGSGGSGIIIIRWRNKV